MVAAHFHPMIGGEKHAQMMKFTTICLAIPSGNRSRKDDKHRLMMMTFSSVVMLVLLSQNDDD